MSKQVKISKLCLEIGGKKIELTMKQAKELKDVLNDTFGGEDTIIYRDRWHQPYQYWQPNTWYASTNADIPAIGGNTTDATVFKGAEWNGAISGNQVTLTAQ